MKIVCCTMFSPSHQVLADISIPNFQQYCAKHGYDLKIINIENDKWEYKKHEAFEKIFSWLPAGGIIWYKDIDSIVTNMSIPITSFVDDEHDFFITMDFNELNGGSVIIKNTISGIDFNNYILTKTAAYENEQNCFNDQTTLDLFSDKIKILNHPSINSYDYSCYSECKDYIGREDLGDWKPGNFVIHFPGLGLNDRVELMKEYSQKIIE